MYFMPIVYVYITLCIEIQADITMFAPDNMAFINYVRPLLIDFYPAKLIVDLDAMILLHFVNLQLNAGDIQNNLVLSSLSPFGNDGDFYSLKFLVESGKVIVYPPGSSASAQVF